MIESNVFSRPKWTVTASAVKAPRDPIAIHQRRKAAGDRAGITGSDYGGSEIGQQPRIKRAG
jgi:hypothetical protein